MNPDATSNLPRIQTGDRRARWALLGVWVCAAVAYSPALRAPFIYDDLTAIVENPDMRGLWPLTRFVPGPAKTTLAGRPVAAFSIALNYALGELNPLGYHLVNLALHLCTGLLLFGVVRRTLLRPCWAGRFDRAAPWLALSVTALWTCHPLNSEAVIYVVQRTELLVGLCLLLTLYCFLRAETGELRHVWRMLAIVACALGMASKESMAAAPLLVLLYDATFVAGSFAKAISRRRWFYAALAGTWLILGLLLRETPRSDTVGFNLGISPFEYLWTQAGVLLWYLRLTVWPAPLSLTYDDWPIAASLAAVWPQVLLIAVLFALSVVGAFRRKPLGFVGLWCFLLLAPSSSFVPIVTEPAAERRMYVPLMALCALVVVGVYWLLHVLRSRTSRPLTRIAIVATVIVFGASCGGTFARSTTYQSAQSIWEDTVAKRPASITARANLGNVLLREGDTAAALEQYATAVALVSSTSEDAPNPTSSSDAATQTSPRSGADRRSVLFADGPRRALLHYNYAGALLKSGASEQAAEQFRLALALNPQFADAHSNLGIALEQLKRKAEASEQYRAALAQNPKHVGALNNLARLLAGRGELTEAEALYRRALAISPDSTAVRRNLADALLGANQFGAAEAEYRGLLRVVPNDARAHLHLAIALAMQERKRDAVDELHVALRIDPTMAQAQEMLAALSAELQREGGG